MISDMDSLSYFVVRKLSAVQSQTQSQLELLILNKCELKSQMT